MYLPRRLIYFLTPCFLFAIFFQIKQTESQKNMMMPIIAVAHPKFIHVNDVITAIGTIKSSEVVDISPSVSGTVSKLYFDSGEKVNEGDILLELQNDDLKALVQKDEAKYNLSMIQANRYNKLLNTDAVSISDFDQAQSQAAQDLAQLNYDKAELERTIIKAPFSGVLGVRQIDNGEYLSPGQAIVTLQNDTSFYVDFFVSEKQSDKISLGQNVKITSNQGRKHSWVGKVVALESRMNESTRGLSIRAKVTSPLNGLISGMYADISIDIPSKHRVVSIPQNAVSYTPYGTLIYIYRNHKVYQKYIHIGRQFGDVVSVQQGINIKNTVVDAGQQKLFDGESVLLDGSIKA